MSHFNLHQYVLRFILAVVILLGFGAISRAAVAQGTIFLQLPPFLPAIQPALSPIPNLPMGALDAPSAVDLTALPGDIEALTGGVLHVAGPIVWEVESSVASGSLLRVPVSFAVEMQADEEIKVPGSRLAKGQRLYRAYYFDPRTEVIVRAWCGPFRLVGLFPSTLLLCLEKTADGRAKVYYSAQNAIHQELYGEWYAAGLVDRDWAVIDWPKLSPVVTPDADKTLELVWSGKTGIWLGWRLSKAGVKTPVILGNQDGSIASSGQVAGGHTVLVGASQILVFDRTPDHKGVKLSGAVKRP